MSLRLRKGATIFCSAAVDSTELPLNSTRVMVGIGAAASGTVWGVGAPTSGGRGRGSGGRGTSGVGRSMTPGKRFTAACAKAAAGAARSRIAVAAATLLDRCLMTIAADPL